MTTILPAVPAGNLASGQALPAQELHDQLERLGRGDPETAHVALDCVLISVLQEIRDGHPDPVGLATAALEVNDVHFPMWFS